MRITLLLEVLGAFICGALWTGLIAPALARVLFTVPLAYGWGRRVGRKNSSLSRRQVVFAFGVFDWGLGMFLLLIVQKFLERALEGKGGPELGWTIMMAVVCVLMGWTVGAYHPANAEE